MMRPKSQSAPKKILNQIGDKDLIVIFGKLDANKKPQIVISKKIAKKAIDRNRIKRIIREAQRNIKAENIKRIIIKKNIADLKSTQIAENLARLLKI